MIKRIADSMVAFYAKNDYIAMHMRSSYAYGFEILLSTLMNVLAVLFVAFFFHSIIGAVFYMGSFILTRTVCGGYHAKSHLACILLFTMIFVVFCFVIRMMDDRIVSLYNLVTSIVSGIVIWCVAPVEASNKPLSKGKRIKFRRLSLGVGVAYVAIAVLLYFDLLIALPSRVTVFAFSGELAASVTMVLGAVENAGYC